MTLQPRSSPGEADVNIPPRRPHSELHAGLLDRRFSLTASPLSKRLTQIANKNCPQNFARPKMRGVDHGRVLDSAVRWSFIPVRWAVSSASRYQAPARSSPVVRAVAAASTSAQTRDHRFPPRCGLLRWMVSAYRVNAVPVNQLATHQYRQRH